MGTEKPGDVAQVRDAAVDVGTRPKRKHAMDPHIREPSRALLERVDHGDRLAVREARDHVGAGLDVVEHHLGGAALCLQGRMDVGRAAQRNVFPSPR